MSQAVQEILERIGHLPEADRMELDAHLARIAEDEWRREAMKARLLAAQKGIDQAAIDQAIENLRYPR